MSSKHNHAGGSEPSVSQNIIINNKGGAFGSRLNDVFILNKDGIGKTSQIHVYGKDGDDKFFVDVGVSNRHEYVTGHHIFTGSGADKIIFQIDTKQKGKITGRIDDFTYGQDTIFLQRNLGQLIEVDLKKKLPAGVQLVEVNGQQAILIDNKALYVLEGARSISEMPSGSYGDQNSNGEENHFPKWPSGKIKYLDHWVDNNNFIPKHLHSPEQSHIHVNSSSNSSHAGAAIITTGSSRADFINSEHLQQRDRISGGLGNDTLGGGKGRDTIFGGDGKDFLYGGTDSDQLYGDSGADIIHGGTENDLIFGGNGNDVIYGDPGDDKLYGGNDRDILHGGQGNDFLSGGLGNDTLFGGDGGDILYGGEGADVIRGGGGRDTISGGSGSDLLDAGIGNDSIHGNTGADTIYGRDGNDIIHGGYGNDVLYGGGGNDTLYGNQDRDVIYGGDGSDIIFGGAGNDKIFGQHGRDKMYGDSGSDYLYGELGDDSVYGGGGDDFIFGGGGTDILFGGPGRDLIYGGTGNDTLYGGEGKDTIVGGSGTNAIFGGAGNDTFVFLEVASHKHKPSGTIFDYTPGVDKIDLSRIDANKKLGGNQEFSLIWSRDFGGVAGQLRVDKDSAGIVVEGDTNGDRKSDFFILLKGSLLLSINDFVL